MGTMVSRRQSGKRSGEGRRPRHGKRGLGATADEVDDLETIAVVQLRSCPPVAGNDVAVQFNGDAIAFHAQVLDQRSDGERIGQVTRFAIDFEVHEFSFIFRERKSKRRGAVRSGEG